MTNWLTTDPELHRHLARVQTKLRLCLLQTQGARRGKGLARCRHDVYSRCHSLGYAKKAPRNSYLSFKPLFKCLLCHSETLKLNESLGLHHTAFFPAPWDIVHTFPYTDFRGPPTYARHWGSRRIKYSSCPLGTHCLKRQQASKKAENNVRTAEGCTKYHEP